MVDQLKNEKPGAVMYFKIEIFEEAKNCARMKFEIFLWEKWVKDILFSSHGTKRNYRKPRILKLLHTIELSEFLE